MQISRRAADRGQWESDQGRRERSAKDHDGGMRIHEHPQVAAHENERAEHDRACDQTEAGSDIHGPTQHTPNARSPTPGVASWMLARLRLRDGYSNGLTKPAVTRY